MLVGNALLVLAQPWLVDAQYAMPGFPDDGLGLSDHARRELAHAGVRSIAVWDGVGIARLRDARLPAAAPRSERGRSLTWRTCAPSSPASSGPGSPG